MNAILNMILERNKMVMIFFAVGGVVSFFLYTGRGKKLESNTFWCVIPVSLWLFVERLLSELDIQLPLIWKNISVVICLLLILLMVVFSFVKDFSIYAIFNILGNVFVMYALPSIIFTVIVSVLIIGGGAALVLLSIPLLAFGFAVSNHRVYD